MLSFVFCNDNIEPIDIDITSSSFSSIVAGDSVTITCTVTLPDSVPPTLNIDWQKPDDLYTPVYPITSGQTVTSKLFISNIATSEAGKYTCNVTMSDTDHASIYITVQSKSRLGHLNWLIQHSTFAFSSSDP